MVSMAACRGMCSVGLSRRYKFIAATVVEKIGPLIGYKNHYRDHDLGNNNDFYN